jgi:hypothetical protein
MQDIKDGGPAFPVQDASTWQAHGMTLRDYFAAKAMQGQLSRSNANYLSDDQHAEYAYAVADAMIKAREAK